MAQQELRPPTEWQMVSENALEEISFGPPLQDHLRGPALLNPEPRTLPYSHVVP
jgi:hypothetical protein